MRTVTVVDRVSSFRLVDLEKAYALRPDKKHVWLQRTAIWVLEKLGARHRVEQETVTQHHINTVSAMEKLHRSAGAFRRSYGEWPSTVLMGRDDYVGLMTDGAPSGQFAFNGAYHVGENSVRKVMGMRIVVLPEMKGILPLTPSQVQEMRS